MTDEQYKKQKFITHELLELLKAIDKDILSTEYQIIGSEEYVQVNWLYHGTGKDYHMRTCITADSLRAIVIDVIKHID